MKIYIIGPSGSGKTTLSKKLSQKYNIKSYELDKIVYDDDHGNIKRSDKEIEQLFTEVLKKKSWIIEDVGRNKFIKGRTLADKIYYLKIPKKIVYKRVITRWIKQRLGKEPYNYPPTFYQLIDMIRVAVNYFKKEKAKLESLNEHKDKLIYLEMEDIEKLVCSKEFCIK